MTREPRTEKLKGEKREGGVQAPANRELAMGLWRRSNRKVLHFLCIIDVTKRVNKEIIEKELCEDPGSEDP